MGLDGCTQDDLRDLRDYLTRQIRVGFSGVHARQDLTNGRVMKNEIALGEHGIRLINIERDLFTSPRKGARATDDVNDGERQPLTRHELTIVLKTLGGAAAFVTFVWKVLPFLMRAIEH